MEKANLVTIKSEAKRDELIKWITSGSDIWLGIKRNEEGEPSWTTGDKLNYQNWYEPIPYKKEDCPVIKTIISQPKWNVVHF